MSMRECEGVEPLFTKNNMSMRECEGMEPLLTNRLHWEEVGSMEGNPRMSLRISVDLNQGMRSRMLDMMSIKQGKKEVGSTEEFTYVAIFDGHGGPEAVEYARKHLAQAIVSKPAFWSEYDEDILGAIKDGFIETQYAMLNDRKVRQSIRCGTTASTAFIKKDYIYIGHLGSSGIVLGYNDHCSGFLRGAPLTKVHRTQGPSELMRKTKPLGTVFEASGCQGVRSQFSNKYPTKFSTYFGHNPSAAIARSLGDLWSYDHDTGTSVVSPEPDVCVHHVDLNKDKCLIFGTDGLWNMLTPEEAVGIVRKADFTNKVAISEGEYRTWLNPSKCLVDKALDKCLKLGRRLDNTSAITVFLDPPRSKTGLSREKAEIDYDSENDNCSSKCFSNGFLKCF